MPAAPADATPHHLASRFDLTIEQVAIAGRTFPILAVRDTNTLLDAIDPATFAVDERLPFWAELWPSSIALARMCLQELPLHGRRVLELGCGLGLAGIAAASAGASVTMTDYEEDALTFARWNFERNGTGSMKPTCVRHLDWRSPGDPGQFDVVIGSDIIYDRQHAGPLLELLERVLVPDGLAILTDPGREAGRDFLAAAGRRGFEIAMSETSVEWRGRTQVIVCSTLRRPGDRR